MKVRKQNNLCRGYNCVTRFNKPIASVRQTSFSPYVFSLITIALWVLGASLINTAQFPDNVEEFVWAQSFEWTYWKHPPLLTWLLATCISLWGFWTGWTYVLATLCFAGTAFFTWRIAHRLLGPQVATVAVMLISLHQGFSFRAQMYNHNTLLLLLAAMTAWATLAALDSKRLAAWAWALVGLCAGLAMLTKYQALVPLLGIVLALYLSGQLRSAQVRWGVVLASVVALAIFAPHVQTMAAQQFSTLRYAKHAAVDLDAMARVVTLLGNWVNQFRQHIPVLIAVALFALTAKPAEPASNRHADPVPQPEAKAWMMGLLAWPVLALALVSLFGGVRLQAAWGLQSFQFLAVFIAWRLVKSFPAISFRSFLPVVVVAHVLSACFAFWTWTTPLHFMQSETDRNYPAAAIASAVMRDWRKATPCPLRYVVGPSFEAGLVSMYAGTYPVVQEDGTNTKSPWVDPVRMQALGAVYVARNGADLPPGLVFKDSMLAPRRKKKLGGSLYWGIALPQVNCQTPAAAP